MPFAAAVTVPGQVLTTFGVLATVSVPGKLSVSDEFSVIALALLLPSVIVSVDVEPTLIVVGLKDLVSVGGSKIVSVALATSVLLAPSVVVSALIGIVFGYCAGVLDTTSACKVQLPLAGIVALVRLILVPATSAATAPPEQVVEAFGVLAIVSPAGRLSVRAEPVKVCALLLAIVMVSVEVCPALTAVGLKALVMTGALTTFSAAVAIDWLLKPSLEVTPPAGMMFV